MINMNLNKIGIKTGHPEPTIGSWIEAGETRYAHKNCSGKIKIISFTPSKTRLYDYRVRTTCDYHTTSKLRPSYFYHKNIDKWNLPGASKLYTNEEPVCNCDIKMALTVEDWHTCGRSKKKITF